MTAFTDGSFSHCGEMGIGYVLLKDDVVVRKVSQHLGKNGGVCSSNYAEYAAVWALLNDLDQIEPGAIVVYCDSRLVVNQIRGEWYVGNGTYSSMAHKVLAKLKQTDRLIKFKWIPRAENMAADQLSKEAHMHRGCVATIPYVDSTESQ